MKTPPPHPPPPNEKHFPHKKSNATLSKWRREQEWKETLKFRFMVLPERKLIVLLQEGSLLLID